jgi:hypothetical protein
MEPERTIGSFAIFTYLWVLALSTWGGVVNYLSKMRQGGIARFNLTELIGDMCISGFTGLITFWLCQASNFSELVTAPLVGISGHMGARLIGKLEQVLSRKFDLPHDEVVTIIKKEGPPGVF